MNVGTASPGIAGACGWAYGGVWLLGAVMLALHVDAKAQAAGHSDANVEVASREDLQNNWTSFRGFGGNGRATRAKPPRTWSVKEGKNILWRSPLPKQGMSSPVVWKTQLFLTGADEASRQIYCFDVATGKLSWQHDISNLPGAPSDGGLPRVLETTGFAAPTVATDGNLVAAIFATGELVCVNLSGARVWARHLGFPNNSYGHASSLICHHGLLMVQYDQKDRAKLIAFDMATGEIAWQADRDAISWSSPILVDHRGTTQLVLSNCKSVDSYDPMTGERRWHVECLGGEVASSAAYANGIVFVANENAVASAIDIGSRAEPQVLWQWAESLPDSASPLADDNFLIVPTSFGVVTCLDAKTGRVFWEHEFDQGFYSSPILADGCVHLVDLAGKMHVFRMADHFELLGVSDLGEPAYATPAFVGDRIYVRGLGHLFCIGASLE